MQETENLNESKTKAHDYPPDTYNDRAASVNCGSLQPLGPSTAQWAEVLTRALRSSARLAKLEIPYREPVLGKWFRQGDLGFIYGPRGLGKTWMNRSSGVQKRCRRFALPPHSIGCLDS